MSSVVVGISLAPHGLKSSIYNIETKESINDYKDRYIGDYIEQIIKKYGNDLKKVVVYDLNELLDRNDYSRKYGDLFYFATEDEMMCYSYFLSPANFDIGDSILVFFYNNDVRLYQCTNISERILTLQERQSIWFGRNQKLVLEDVVKEFEIEVNKIHIGIESGREKELYEKATKANVLSVSCIEGCNGEILIGRMLIGDPDIQYIIKFSLQQETKMSNIRDCGIIYIPKLVQEYEPRTDIMGIDFGATRCVVAVSRNRQIHVIPFDNSSPGDLWTESVVSFDEEKPLFGKAAIRRLKTKPNHVLFDTKVLASGSYKYERLNWSNEVWEFKFTVKNDRETYFTTETINGIKTFTLADINKIFLEAMKKEATDYQSIFNNGKPMQKAVITVPYYFKVCVQSQPPEQHTCIENIIEAAKLANIEIIDIIEETHADLLYYLSNKRYSNLIKIGMNIAIFDIGGGTEAKIVIDGELEIITATGAVIHALQVLSGEVQPYVDVNSS